MSRPGIHPSYTMSTVTCACGHSFVTASTRGSFTTEICSMCHPFFTGKTKLLDTAGRIERFEKKYAGRKTAKPVAPKSPTT